MLMGVDKHRMTPHPFLVNVRESEFRSEFEGCTEPAAAPGVAGSSASFLLRLCLSPRTSECLGHHPFWTQSRVCLFLQLWVLARVPCLDSGVMSKDTSVSGLRVRPEPDRRDGARQHPAAAHRHVGEGQAASAAAGRAAPGHGRAGAGRGAPPLKSSPPKGEQPGGRGGGAAEGVLPFRRVRPCPGRPPRDGA